jgi:hypothetical protein
MPGKTITIKQVKIYMTSRQAGCSQLVAAAKAGISERSGRDIEHGKRLESGHRYKWRTRPDPLATVWEQELVPLLEQTPSLSPITLLEELQTKYPGLYPDRLLRTLQRRVKQWKALFGPEKEVVFRQVHEPGRLGLSDFTSLRDLVITIHGKPLKHLLYHFRLSYSGWSYLKVILGGESYTALAEGLQDALWRLGGSPREHRTDSLSAAFKNLTALERQDLTANYASFCQHYHMHASRNNPGVSHENGSIESAHGHIKRRIKQALLLRNSCDFLSIVEYQDWLDNVIRQHNRRNVKEFDIERQALQPLPGYKTIDYTELLARVSTSSTIDVRRVTYTVPSRLQGETLRIHLYHDRLQCYLGSQLVITLKRIYAHGTHRTRSVDYRHVIHSLARKPQAFRYSCLRDDLLPNESYKQIWCHVEQNLSKRAACKFMVALLHLAATNNCETELANDVLAMIANHQELSLTPLKTKYQVIHHDLPSITVAQHLLTSYNQFIGGYHG